ncbi:hypothetical protein N9W61_02070 [Algibacter sp.]|nr:hypothetical protein [Algibacter sp.]
MKFFAIILFLGLGIFFLTKMKPEPYIIKINNAPATQSCVTPNGSNTKQHYGCCTIKGRAYYMLENAKKED